MLGAGFHPGSGLDVLSDLFQSLIPSDSVEAKDETLNKSETCNHHKWDMDSELMQGLPTVHMMELTCAKSFYVAYRRTQHQCVTLLNYTLNMKL